MTTTHLRSTSDTEGVTLCGVSVYKVPVPRGNSVIWYPVPEGINYNYGPRITFNELPPETREALCAECVILAMTF